MSVLQLRNVFLRGLRIISLKCELLGGWMALGSLPLREFNPRCSLSWWYCYQVQVRFTHRVTGQWIGDKVLRQETGLYSESQLTGKMEDWSLTKKNHLLRVCTPGSFIEQRWGRGRGGRWGSKAKRTVILQISPRTAKLWWGICSFLPSCLLKVGRILKKGTLV